MNVGCDLIAADDAEVVGWFVATTQTRGTPISVRSGQTGQVVGILLSVTFACGLIIACAHVVNRRFVAPVYDVVANLTAFSCAVGASLLLGHWVPAGFSAVAIMCWLVLARRTLMDVRLRKRTPGWDPVDVQSRPARDGELD